MMMVLCGNYRGYLTNHDSYYRCNLKDDGTIVVVDYFVVPDVHHHDFGSCYVRVTFGNRSATWKGLRSCSSFLCKYHLTCREQLAVK